MSKKRTVSISYTSREFDSIKTDLLNYVKRYYPNSYRDFNEASFGSLMIDTVAYIGDILSFYIDEGNRTQIDNLDFQFNSKISNLLNDKTNQLKKDLIKRGNYYDKDLINKYLEEFNNILISNNIHNKLTQILRI